MSRIFLMGIVIAGLTVHSSVSLGAKKKNSSRTVTHWQIETSAESPETRRITPPQMPSHLSDREKLAVAVKARDSKKAGASAVYFVDGIYNPPGAETFKPIDQVRDCGANKYCRDIDSLINTAQAIFSVCPRTESFGFEVFPSSGMNQFGIDKTCIQNQMAETLSLAKTLLPMDRNLDWVAGALALNSDCKAPLLRPQSPACDAFDLSIRTLFTVDLLNRLKNHPLPLKEIVSSRIQFGNSVVEVESGNIDKNKTQEYDEVVWGELEIARVAPGYYPGRILVIYRDNPGTAYATPFSGTLKSFAERHADDLCKSKGGVLLSTAEENFRVGILDRGPNVDVFYMALCRVRKPNL